MDNKVTYRITKFYWFYIDLLIKVEYNIEVDAEQPYQVTHIRPNQRKEDNLTLKHNGKRGEEF